MVIATNNDEKLTPAEAAPEVGWTKNYLLLKVKRGEGPPCIRVSPRKLFFRRSDIQRWMNDRYVVEA